MGHTIYVIIYPQKYQMLNLQKQKSELFHKFTDLYELV